MIELDKDYWNNRFESLDTPWDLGNVSPALKDYIDQIGNKNIAILIPGCGNGYEAEYLMKNGFTNITLIDISSTLTKMLENRMASYLGNQLKIITGNFILNENSIELKSRIDKINAIPTGDYETAKQLFSEDKWASYIIGSVISLLWEKILILIRNG